MKKKFRNVGIILLIILALTACNNADGNTNILTENTTTTTAINQSDIPKDYTAINPKDCVFVSDTDAQANIGQYPTRVYTKSGYYYIRIANYIVGGYDLLKFKDYKTGEDVPLCSKLDCKHDSKECDAYLPETGYYTSHIAYQNGHIYMARMEEDYQVLDKISPDGTEREKSCTIGRVLVEDEEGKKINIGGYKFQVHRGYVYYTTAIGDDVYAELRRVKLDSDEEPEILCSTGKEDGTAIVNLYRIKPYGKYVMFQMYEQPSVEVCEGSLYAYEIETGVVRVVAEGIIRPYIVVEDSLYYYDMQNNIHKMNLETGKAELFWKCDKQVESLELFDYKGKIVALEQSVEYMDEDTGVKHWIDIQYIFNEKGEIVETRNSFKDELLPTYVIE